jgi:hypothetical protein
VLGRELVANLMLGLNYLVFETYVDCAGRRALLLMPLEKVMMCHLACREARPIRGALIVAVVGGRPPGPDLIESPEE